MTADPIADAVTTSAGLDRLLDDLRDATLDIRLLTDPIERERYRRDETAYLDADLPGAVALPADTTAVSTILALATKHRVPIVPRGAGSGLSGGSAGIAGGLTIVLTRMNRVLEVDRENLCVVTQPGILNAELKKVVEVRGCSTHRTRRAPRSARSAGTSQRTQVVCAA